MVLNNVILIDSDNPVNIQISGTQIENVTGDEISYKIDPVQINFTNVLAFPGLVNSHDHLDFNLFPQLGNKIYSSYTEWGKDIHETHKEAIAKVLKVPLLFREQWGIIKNMICGVTTVVNHGEKLQTKHPLITVHEQYHCLHSVQFEKNWRAKLNNPLKRKLPVVIHVGEGRNDDAHYEIDQLIKWNLLRKKLIGVHAVAMSDIQAKSFSAIIWCPQSNYFLLDRTAPIKKLKEHTSILFGTDSTLTGNWDIWDHIALARKTDMLTDKELYNSLNISASNIWNTDSNAIKIGLEADVVIASKNDKEKSIDTFFTTTPKDILLVLHKGSIRLFDATLYNQLTQTDLAEFSKIYIDGVCKYVKSDVPALINSIRQYYPEANFPVTLN